MSQKNIESLFEVITMKGLGRVLRCKICKAKFKKDFIVVGRPDAERHLLAHEIYGDLLYEEKPIKPKIEKKVKLKKES